MLKQYQNQASKALQAVFDEDSQQEHPVVQSISLFFWQNFQQWLHQIALMQQPFTIALTGASGSGKSFIRETLVQRLSEITQVSSFTQDNYYRDFEADFTHLPLASFYDEINLDDPAHIRFDKMAEDLQNLQQSFYGDTLYIPKLRFGTPTTKPTILENGIAVKVTPFVVTEGIHAFFDPAITPIYNLKIFVDIDEKTRRQRWLARNLRENRGTTDNMWNTTVECLENSILPTRAVADLVINNNAPQDQVVVFLDSVIDALCHCLPVEILPHPEQGLETSPLTPHREIA